MHLLGRSDQRKVGAYQIVRVPLWVGSGDHATGRSHAANGHWQRLGARMPWYRVRLNSGLGTGAASLAMKSSGSNTTWVVPSR
jgi:hypothetical protein